MMKTKVSLLAMGAAGIFLFIGCQQPSGSSSSTAKSSACQLLSFTIPKSANSFLTADLTGTIDNTMHTVTLKEFPNHEPRTLVASFTVSAGATVRVDNIQQISGKTKNDFSGTLTYTVTAESGYATTYSVCCQLDSYTRKTFYTTTFAGTWVPKSGSDTITFDYASYSNSYTTYHISYYDAIYTQSEFDELEYNNSYFWSKIAKNSQQNYSDNDYTKHGYIYLSNSYGHDSICGYSFDDSKTTLTFNGVQYTKQGAGSGSLPSGFDITSGSWNYNPTSSSGGSLAFTSGGSASYTAKTTTAYNSYTGTYTLSGTTLTLTMSNGLSGTSLRSFTDKFTVSATDSSLTLTLQSSSSNVAGNQTDNDTSISVAIQSMWGTGQNSSLTSVTLSQQ